MMIGIACANYEESHVGDVAEDSQKMMPMLLREAAEEGGRKTQLADEDDQEGQVNYCKMCCIHNHETTALTSAVILAGVASKST